MVRLIRLAALVLTLSLAARTADAAFITYITDLSGPAESPPNASPGFGFAFVDFDTTAHTMRVRATFSGLVATTSTGAPSGTTAAHIHTPTPTPGEGVAGVATQTPSFALFPLGVRAGAFDQTLDMLQASSYNPAFITANGGTVAGAEAVFLSGLNSGRAYLNIHTNAFGGGEIRGFLTAVPEPASLASLVVGALAGSVVALGRKRRRETLPTT